MSTLIVVRLDNVAVIGTDSRIVDVSGTRLVSDSQQKVFELAPGLFYAWSGYTQLADLQVQIARKLADSLSDIHGFADLIDEVSHPGAEAMIGAIAEARQQNPQLYEAHLRGELPFHAYALLGSSDGQPGFIFREYFLNKGQIECRTTGDSFRTPEGHGFALSGVRLHGVLPLIQTPQTWAKGPVSAVEKILSEVISAEPLCGGAPQIACIDQSGARWVHRPIADTALTAGTISASISMTSPTLTVSGAGGAFTINLDSTNGFKCTGNGTTTTINNSTVLGFTKGISIQDNSSGIQTYVYPFSFNVLGGGTSTPAVQLGAIGSNATPAGELTLRDSSASGSLVLNSGGTPTIAINGQQIITQRQFGPGGAPSGWADPTAQSWVSSLYTALKTHGLIS